MFLIISEIIIFSSKENHHTSLHLFLPEFVEVILLPLDEFQIKIDGEASVCPYSDVVM